MATDLTDSKMGPKYEIGQSIRTYDHSAKIVNGTITEVGEETICVQWEDLIDDTEYERSKIEIKGDFFYEI